MSDPRFGLQGNLDFLYANKPRRLAFGATTHAEFFQWKQELRKEVLELLGLTGREIPAVKAEKLQAKECLGYTEEKYALDVGEGAEAPIYLLVPRAEPPFKTVLVFHGHNPSVQPILGHYPDEEQRKEGLAKDGNYAQALAQQGYLVCAVEQRGFGERLSGVQDNNRSCRHLAFEYMMQGRSLIGERCWDGMRAIDYLETRDDRIPGALGCTGNSGGGTTTTWLSAIEERITVSVPSCYFCSFKASILGMRHCECNYVPRMLELAEMGDLAAMIAPRPLRAIAGEQDRIFPVAAVREQFETVRRAYALHGAEDRCSLAVHPGPHAYNHALSHEWFGEWL